MIKARIFSICKRPPPCPAAQRVPVIGHREKYTAPIMLYYTPVRAENIGYLQKFTFFSKSAQKAHAAGISSTSTTAASAMSASAAET